MPPSIGYLLLLAVTFSAVSCNSPSVPNNDTVNPKEPALPLVGTVNLYDQPAGELTQTLAPGDYFQLSGQQSADLYWRRTGADTLLEPYLEVLLADSSRHWLYADPHYFDLKKEAEQWQWNNRLRSILSPDQWRAYQQLQEQWSATTLHTPLLLLFQATRKLRDELETALRAYPRLPLVAYETVLPGCLAYYHDNNVAWWIDFNQWHQRAEEQQAVAEQALFNFYATKVYPPDGMEYHYPAWQFPVGANQAHSLLGRGQHLKLLHALDSLQQQFSFANAEWDRIRDHLLQDLTTQETTYWEPWSVIDSTLRLVLTQELLGLSEFERERIILHQERLRQQGEHGPQFDFRNR
ncbi:MAG: hypothetical protein AAFZ63_15555 [Bacteroidota bacterium]